MINARPPHRRHEPAHGPVRPATAVMGRGGWTVALTEEDKATIRAAAARRAPRLARDRGGNPRRRRATVQRMMRLHGRPDVPDEYVPMMMEVGARRRRPATSDGIAGRRALPRVAGDRCRHVGHPHRDQARAGRRAVRRARRRTTGVGGTWFENTYPAAADVANHLLLPSAPNPDWTEFFAAPRSPTTSSAASHDFHPRQDPVSHRGRPLLRGDDLRALWSIRAARGRRVSGDLDANAIVSVVGS